MSSSLFSKCPLCLGKRKDLHHPGRHSSSEKQLIIARSIASKFGFSEETQTTLSHETAGQVIQELAPIAICLQQCILARQNFATSLEGALRNLDVRNAQDKQIDYLIACALSDNTGVIRFSHPNLLGNFCHICSFGAQDQPRTCSHKGRHIGNFYTLFSSAAALFLHRQFRLFQRQKLITILINNALRLKQLLLHNIARLQQAQTILCDIRYNYYSPIVLSYRISIAFHNILF